jgi:hypothetical protein
MDLCPSRRLLLMCDYAADPVWCEPSGESLSLESLALSAATMGRLRDWAAWYEDRGEDEPVRDLAGFESEGLALWELVRAELGGEWEVGYFSEQEQRRLWAR